MFSYIAGETSYNEASFPLEGKLWLCIVGGKLKGYMCHLNLCTNTTKTHSQLDLIHVKRLSNQLILFVKKFTYTLIIFLE